MFSFFAQIYECLSKLAIRIDMNKSENLEKRNGKIKLH